MVIYEPRSEKTGLWGFRPGHTQTMWEVEGLYYSCREKTKVPISFAVTAKLIDLRLCFRICKIRPSHDAAHII